MLESSKQDGLMADDISLDQRSRIDVSFLEYRIPYQG